MCERSGKRGCCIVYVEKLSFMHEKRASPRLNIRHVNLAVSSSTTANATMVQLNPDSDFHFEILRDLSAAVFGGGDISEVLTAAYQIVPGDFESYSSAFDTLANNLLAPRASAFEPRIRAALALDGLYEFGPLLLQAFPKPLITIFNTGNQTAFNDEINAYRASPAAGTQFRWIVDQGTWAFNTLSPFDWMAQLQRYTLEGITDQIPGPIFVADSATDTFTKGQGAILAAKLGKCSTYYKFDAASGIGHAGVGGYVMQNQVAYDWFQGILDGC